ncbi:MAG TPA: hypothetical protein VK040_02455 [Balneolaceae bacterium]|nr:hypothetical protein [Balneolaceae bacterium]
MNDIFLGLDDWPGALREASVRGPSVYDVHLNCIFDVPRSLPLPHGTDLMFQNETGSLSSEKLPVFHLYYRYRLDS